MKTVSSSVLFLLLYIGLVAADPKFSSRGSSSHSYSRPSPSYHHPSPSYHHPSPSYHHPAPAPAPSYHHPAPAPAPSYHHPSPSYHHPAPSHPSPSHVSYPSSHGLSGNSKPSVPHAYPTSNSGLSGGAKPSTPFGGTPIGGHITSTNVKPIHTQPTHTTNTGSHITSTNVRPNHNQPIHSGSTGAHGYPSANGGLSGHGTNARPMPNQPFQGTHIGGQPGYPASNGLSGNSRPPNTGHIQPTHIQPTHNQPIYNQPTYHQPTFGHIPAHHPIPVVPVTYGVAGPVYTTSSLGYHPTFVTHTTHSSGSDLNSMLLGLAVYNSLRSGHSHDHYYNHYGYGYHGHPSHTNVNNYYYGDKYGNQNVNANQASPTQSEPNTANTPTAASLGLKNCTLALSNDKGTDTITIPCEIASSFAAQNTTAAPLPAATSDSKLNCTIAVIKNNGLTEFTQIPCDMITKMAPKPEPPSMKLDCTQGVPGAVVNNGYTPCKIVSTDTFPLEVIPLSGKPPVPPSPSSASFPAGPTGQPINVETPKLLGVPENPAAPPAA